MSLTIPESLNDIIRIFVEIKFAPLTLEQISKRLGISENTLNQRIIRNEDFFTVVAQRPKMITLAPKDPVLFALYSNTCAACLGRKAPEELTVLLIDETLPNPRAWENMLPLCKNCQAKGKKPMQMVVSKPYTGDAVRLSKNGWEYKTLLIRQEVMSSAGSNMMFAALLSKHNAYEGNVYLVFQEPGKSDQWNHLVDKGKISSLTIESILDHFGMQGWEVIGFQYTGDDAGDEREYLLKRARNDDE